MSSGEEKGWKILEGLDTGVVCRNAQAVFHKESGMYSLKSFNWDVSVSPVEKKLFCDAPGCEILLQKLGYFSTLSILWYLVNAKDIPPSGHLIKPAHLKGGELFFRGTHVLPLDRLAERHNPDMEGFAAKGRSLGAEPEQYGDVALRLYPLPRFPVILILWKGCDEFPPRADLLVDSTGEFQLPLDVIWSVTMLSVLIMM
ncbi:MAG: DUF3786 domain-containing protein [Nitrospiraceae bacterium]|nr:MAG: DUF3786 domain-containing protein [Nitrospiraceae bacterium]